MYYTIVLNNDFSYINKVHWKKAFSLISRNKVIVEKWSERGIKTGSTEVKLPLVIRLVKFIRSIFKRRIMFSPKNVHVRDDYTCQYCGTKELSGNRLTIDHVIPRSRGGRNDFDNTVTCCKQCNNWKADKTPREADMYFIRPNFKPYQPTISEFMIKHMKEAGVNQIIEEIFKW